MWPFSNFQYIFRSPGSTAVVSDRITRGFNRSGPMQAVVVDISKVFDKLQCSGILDQIFGPICSFVSKRRL